MMSNPVSGIKSIRVWCGSLALLLVTVPVLAKPFAVKTDISIRHGNWYPLPVKDMKAAATDTALATISKGSIFRIVDGATANADTGHLHLEISLIGPAETAKLTMTLNLKDKPTYISTSSISVHGLDYQGIYNAFEHIGRTAAERLNDKIQALVLEPQPILNGKTPFATDNNQPQKNNPALKSIYDRAQQLKHQYRYQQARVLFEKVAVASGPGTAHLNMLARDELRYGLPIFEVKQWAISMGDGRNSPADIQNSFRNAENLLRQILAENNDNFQRTQEAQRFLDDLAVSRNAIKKALHAVALNRVHLVRRMLGNNIMLTGDCPSREETAKLLQHLESTPILKQINSTTEKTVYAFQDGQTGTEFRLACDGHGIKMIQREEPE